VVAPFVVASKAYRCGRDVIEIHEPLAWVTCVFASLVPRLFPTPIVMSHGLEERHWATMVRHGKEHAGLLRRLWLWVSLFAPSAIAIRYAAHVMVSNERDRTFLLDRRRRHASDVTVAPNGVDPSLYEVHRRPPATPIRFLFLGSWIPRKGSDELTTALRRLDLHMTVAGSGMTDPGIGVRWIEHVEREDLPTLLRDHDVLVLPSLFEGMPLVALEAAAAGLAVVTTDIGGTTDIFGLDEESGGVVLPAGDADALTDALTDLASDLGRVARLQAAARERVRLFTWERTALANLAAYHHTPGAERGDRRARATGRSRVL
jgi:glycosyltransferase involved in cell wall biosynthesis